MERGNFKAELGPGSINHTENGELVAFLMILEATGKMTPKGTIPWCGVKEESLAGQSFSCHNSRVSLPRISLFNSPSCAAGQRPSSAISEVMPMPHPGCFPKECVLHPKSIQGDKRRKKKKSMEKHQEREWKAPARICPFLAPPGRSAGGSKSWDSKPHLLSSPL